MSIVLKQEKKSELPLIAFTTCVPAALGVALFAPFAGGWAGVPGMGGLLGAGGFRMALVAWLFASVGMVASIAHLAKPLRAPRALTNLKTSWLSREIAVVAVFWGLLSLWTVAAFFREPVAAILLDIASVAVGIPLMVIIVRAYKVSTRPAWCGSEGLAELWACVLGAGPTLCLLLTDGCSLRMTFLLLLFAAGALVLDAGSHVARRGRLMAMVPQSDERVTLTLAHYAKLWPEVRRLWWAEGACVILLAVAILAQFAIPAVSGMDVLGAAGGVHAGVAGIGGSGIGGVTLVSHALLVVAAVGQIIVHGLHRNLFYELPVQVRWVVPLRK